jgi:hypothetical protein
MMLRKGYILVQATLWRDSKDEQPCCFNIAFGSRETYIPNMKKFYVEDTATSSWVEQSFYLKDLIKQQQRQYACKSSTDQTIIQREVGKQTKPLRKVRADPLQLKLHFVVHLKLIKMLRQLLGLLEMLSIKLVHQFLMSHQLANMGIFLKKEYLKEGSLIMVMYAKQNNANLNGQNLQLMENGILKEVNKWVNYKSLMALA